MIRHLFQQTIFNERTDGALNKDSVSFEINYSEIEFFSFSLLILFFSFCSKGGSFYFKPTEWNEEYPAHLSDMMIIEWKERNNYAFWSTGIMVFIVILNNEIRALFRLSQSVVAQWQLIQLNNKLKL